MKNTEKLRKILAAVFVCIAVFGAYRIMTRENPFDENIGDVAVTNGEECILLDRHKYSYNDKDTQKKLESFVTLKKAGDVPFLKYDPDNHDSNISVSYGEEYLGELSYSVFDSDYKPVVENQPSLTIPAEKGKRYYVQIKVNWGEEDRYAVVFYYFGIEIIE